LKIIKVNFSYNIAQYRWNIDLIILKPEVWKHDYLTNLSRFTPYQDATHGSVHYVYIFGNKNTTAPYFLKQKYFIYSSNNFLIIKNHDSISKFREKKKSTI
jgi:hypothetical protein